MTLFFKKSDKIGPAFFQSLAKGPSPPGAIPIVEGQWTSEKITTTVPQGAEYLMISIRAQKADKISLANWTIF
jgi:hypothetical protein